MRSAPVEVYRTIEESCAEPRFAADRTALALGTLISHTGRVARVLRSEGDVELADDLDAAVASARRVRAGEVLMVESGGAGVPGADEVGMGSAWPSSASCLSGPVAQAEQIAPVGRGTHGGAGTGDLPPVAGPGPLAVTA